MRHARHIFLSGEIQVGKSSLINRVAAMHPQWQIRGFRTITLNPPAEGGGRPVHIVPAHQAHALCSAENMVGIRYVAGQRTAFPRIFETTGVDILNKSEQADLILMDEIGTMENDAPGFQRQVLSLLDGGKPVLGVLKKKDSPFLRAIMARRDVLVIEITRDNADESFLLVDSLLSFAVGKS